jgi:hypothetical protein
LRRTTLIRVASALGCGGALIVATAGGAAAQDPPGNNGTVKVDGVEFDDHPDNQPHVGCTFEIDFYGFDEGDLEADVMFEAIPPTLPAPPVGDAAVLLTDTVDIGEDPAGGATDLDAHEEYDLTAALVGITPHPEQGWHVRLSVNAEGSIGADNKFKVFWVSGCETPGTTTSTSTTSTSTTSTTTSGSTTTTAPDSSTTTTPGGSSTTTTPGGSSTTLLSPSSAPTTQPGGPGGGQLPITGNDILPLAAGALALAGVGAAAGILSKRLRTPDKGS